MTTKGLLAIFFSALFLCASVSAQTTEFTYQGSLRDGANLGTFPVGLNPHSVAFDGANIWVANQGSNTVTRLFPAIP